MGGYLDTYGAGDARREGLAKRIAIGLVLLLLAAFLAYFLLKNRREEMQVRQFIESLQRQDYKAAYAYWGCTDEKPCPNYSLNNFLEDWGPQSPYRQAGAMQTSDTIACEEGVLRTITVPGQPPVQVRVDRQSQVLGFAPWPVVIPRDGLYYVRALFARMGMATCAPRRV